MDYPNIKGEVLLENDAVVVQRFTIQPGQWEGIHLDIDSIRNTNKEVDLRKPLQERSAVDLLTVDKIAAGIVSV